MYDAGRVLKNIAVILVGNVATRVFDLLVLVYLARYLGSGEFGNYSFVIAYLFFFTVVTLLGVNKIVVREIAKDRSVERRIIGNALSIRILLAIVSIFLSVTIVNLLNYPSELKILIYIISIKLPISAIRATYASIFEARLRMEYSEFGNFLEAAVATALIFLVMFLKGSLIHIMGSLVIANFCNFVVTFYFSRKFVKPRFEFNPSYTKMILSASIPAGLAIVFRAIYYRIDVVMLSLMKTKFDIGYYSASYMLISALEIIPRAIMMSVFPLMSEYSKFSQDSFEASYEKSFRILLIVTLPIAIYIAVFSREIILLLYKSEFLPSFSALSVLIWSVVFLSLNSLFANLVISTGNERVAAYTTCVMALANIILNLLLIPGYSYVGASVATVLTEILGAAIFFAYINVNLVKNLFLNTIAKLMLLSLLIYFSVSLNTVVLMIPLSLFVYLILLLKLGCLKKEEVFIIMRIFRKKGSNIS